MRFTKLRANGADYILFERGDYGSAAALKEHTPRLCDRRLGIGAQGVILVPDDGAEDCLEIIASDGDKRLFDADAAICFAAASGKETMRITMPGGGLTVNKSSEADVYEVEFEKGSFLPGDVPLACSYPVIEKAVETGNRILLLTALRLGGVYAVHGSFDLDRIDIAYLGARITAHSLFLKKADAVFTQKTSETSMRLRCYRRGTGLTAADTGAAAAALTALCRSGHFARGVPVEIGFDRGEATVICREDDTVWLKTSAKVVFEGNIDL